MTKFKNKPTLLGIFCVLLLSKVKRLTHYSLPLNDLTSIFARKPQVIIYIFVLLLSYASFGQTTFTETAAAFNLNISGSKDGGHAWADYDNDGDIDVLVAINSTSNRNDLMRNNGDGTFTNVQATLVPGMLSVRAERQVAWGDLNNDGLPDFMMTSHGNNPSVVAIQIFIQNVSGTFGDGIGGTAPITVGENASATITVNPLNVEGAGFFDFEGDGDLDIFFDSHNFGIELLRNNYIDHLTSTVVNPAPAGLYTHITTLNGSPNVQFGLNQFATDGDYGTAADVDDDGWVDLFMRKRDENDFFLNQGGTFTSGSDLAQADNGNKGANGLWDLDNDGDLDAVWTENGITQIFRNDGPGVWVALGAGVFPGLPQPASANSGSSSNDIDALAGGDIDNDGDIDVLLVGDSRSYLFINQLNSPTPAPGVVGSGAAMTFTLDAATFNSSNGEGTTMVDVDDDGDLDIYMNITSGSNQLFINNLAAANRNNHLLVNVTEDRNADGTTGGFPGRTAIGTNVLIRDCSGNIISGLRQVNGVFGHGNQQPEEVHFGLPLGENETYIIEVHYPNFNHPIDGITRLIATAIAQPSTIVGTNHFILTTTDAEIIENLNPPDAVDDVATLPNETTVSVQLSLFDNDSEPDGENFFIESIVQPAIGTVVIDDADLGLVTYTYSAGIPFPGTTFTYTITDSTVSICPALGMSDMATVTLNANNPPIATDNTADVTEDIDLTDSGNVITDDDGNGVDSDPEGANIVVIDVDGTPVVGSTAIVGTYGTLTINPDGSYVYDLDNSNLAVQGLGSSDTLTECFDYIIREDEAFVINGNFEQIPGGTNTLTFNATVADGWIASSSSPDVVDPAITAGGMVYNTSPTGGNFMHLAAAESSGTITGEQISYNVTGLVVGNTYTVSWDQTISNGNFAFTFVDAFFDVGIAGIVHTGNTLSMPALGVAAPWEGEQFTFVATNANETLSFLSNLPVGANNRFTHLGLDNVQITGSNNTATAELCVTINGIDDDTDLSLTKTVDNASPDQGVDITFTITIDNSGPSTATNVVMTDVIPTEFTYTHPNFTTTQGTVTFNAGTRAFEWDLGAFALNTGSNITLTYTITVDICGEFNNQAEITNSSLADPDSTPNSGG